MSLATATFWGNIQDSYGMPNPFYRYLIVEGIVENLGPNIRIVSITALTEMGPMPSKNDNPFIIENVDPREAINKAFEILCNHSQIKNLNRQLSIRG